MLKVIYEQLNYRRQIEGVEVIIYMHWKNDGIAPNYDTSLWLFFFFGEPLNFMRLKYKM